MDKFQILCLSGGGFRGLYTASVLAQLENHFKKPIHECFDLICGTSIGGAIATGLAFERSAQDIHDSLNQNGEKIFKKRSRGILKAKYSSAPLREAIEKILPESAKIKNASIPYLTTAINLHTGKPRIFKTPHHKDYIMDGNFPAVDTALATSAAPIFFPPARVGNEDYIDGGLFANAPDLIGIHEAEHYLGIDVTKIHMLSIGTTGAIAGFGHKHDNGWGAVSWLKQTLLVEMAFSAQQGFANNIATHRLGNRHIKIDETHSNHKSFSAGMDDASSSARDQLEAMAARSFMNAANKDNIKAFFEHEPNRAGLKYNFSKESEAA